MTNPNPHPRQCLVDFSRVVREFAESVSQYKSVRSLIQISWYAPNHRLGWQVGPPTRYQTYAKAQAGVTLWMSRWSTMCTSDVYKIVTGSLRVFANDGNRDWANAVMQELETDFGQMWQYREAPRDEGGSGPINLEWVKRVLNGNAVRMLNEASLHGHKIQQF